MTITCVVSCELYNNLTSVYLEKSVCRNQPFGGRARRDNDVHLPKRIMCGSCHQCLFKEKIRKKTKKKGLRISKIRVRELFTHGEGISTPHARHKGWWPLIECAQRDFKIVYFPFCIFLLLGGSTRVLPLLLRILKCNEEFRPT